MKYLFGALALTIPLAVHAEPIPDAHLQMSFNECRSACGEQHAAAFCQEVCGCMTGEMSRHWTMSDFGARMERVRENPEDEQVRAEMDRLAKYCASRIE